MEITIKCGNVDISDRVYSYSSTYEVQENKLIGNVVSKQCTIELENRDDFFTKERLNSVFTIEYDKVLNDTLKVYDEPQSENKRITLTLYDNVVLLNKEFKTDPATYPKTLKAVIDEIGALVGQTFDTSLLENTFLSREINSYDENETCRQIISWIAELSSSNVISTPNGGYVFKPYTVTPAHIITDYDVERFETNDEYNLKRVVYDNGVSLLEHKGATYTEHDNTLYIDGANLFKVNQADVDYIYSKLNEPKLMAVKSIRFATVNEIKPFETIEYKGYFKFCPLNVYIKYSQGVATFNVAEIDGDFDLTSKQTVSKVSSTKKAIRRLKVTQDEQKNQLSIVATDISEQQQKQASLEMNVDSLTTTVGKTVEEQSKVDGKIEQVKKDLSTEVSQQAEGLNITISNLQKELNEMGESTQLVKTYFKVTDKGLAIAQDGNDTSTLMANDHFAILIGTQEVVQIFRNMIKGESANFSNSVQIGHIKATTYENGVAYTWED